MKKEVRVYLISTEIVEEKYPELDSINNISDEEFMDMAEEEGTVYSLKGFQEQWNHYGYEMATPDYSYIRFIEVETQE